MPYSLLAGRRELAIGSMLPPYCGKLLADAGAGPTLGQHNRAILCDERGYSPAVLVKLYRIGII